MDFIIDIYLQLTNFNFDPVAVNFGPIKITWYALSYIVGLLFAWRYALYISKVNYLLKEEVIDYFFNNAILGVIIGGRVGYVIFYNFDYYSENLLEILFIWQGGMSFHGGLIGVVVAQFFTSKRFKVNFFIITDISSLVVPFGFFLGRIANFINGELYGRKTSVPWGVKFPEEIRDPNFTSSNNLSREDLRDSLSSYDLNYNSSNPLIGENNVVIEASRSNEEIQMILREYLNARHPSQIYQALLEGLGLFIMLMMIRRKGAQLSHGILTGTFFIGYAIFRIIGEYFREPSDGYIGVLTRGQFFSTFMILIGIIFIVSAYVWPKRNKL